MATATEIFERLKQDHDKHRELLDSCWKRAATAMIVKRCSRN